MIRYKGMEGIGFVTNENLISYRYQTTQRKCNPLRGTQSPVRVLRSQQFLVAFPMYPRPQLLTVPTVFYWMHRQVFCYYIFGRPGTDFAMGAPHSFPCWGRTHPQDVVLPVLNCTAIQSNQSEAATLAKTKVWPRSAAMHWMGKHLKSPFIPMRGSNANCGRNFFNATSSESYLDERACHTHDMT